MFNLTKEQLCKAYEKLNSWQWDETIGDKPDGFDKLEDYSRTIGHAESKITKSTYITPVMNLIECLIGGKELLRYHNVFQDDNPFKMTNSEFELWYANNR